MEGDATNSESRLPLRSLELLPRWQTESFYALEDTLHLSSKDVGKSSRSHAIETRSSGVSRRPWAQLCNPGSLRVSDGHRQTGGAHVQCRISGFDNTIVAWLLHHLSLMFSKFVGVITQVEATYDNELRWNRLRLLRCYWVLHACFPSPARLPESVSNGTLALHASPV